MSDQPQFYPGMEWSDVARAISQVMTARGEWCGFPLPLPGAGLVLEDQHPGHGMLAEVQKIVDGDRAPSLHVCTDDDLGWYHINDWAGTVRGIEVRVCVYRHEDGRYKHGFELLPPKRNRLMFGCFDALDAWDLNTELTAIQSLQKLLPKRMFKAYMLTGQFLETSKRSGLTYLFRRLRPTVVLSPRRWDWQTGQSTDGNMRIVTTLCLHPLAYYKNTWCGAMVPTDDIIAHLMLMRGWEEGYWRRANQHPPTAPEAGL